MSQQNLGGTNTTNLKSLFKTLVKLVLINQIGVRQELQSFTVDYVLNTLVMRGTSTDYLKSIALFQLLFEDCGDDNTTILCSSKGFVKMQITAAGEVGKPSDGKTLFE